MKIHTIPSLLALSAAALTSGFGQIYINEQFDYDNGPLADAESPWAGTAVSGSTTYTIADIETLNGYAPSGKQLTVSRPSSGNQPLLHLPTAPADPPVTEPWDITAGDRIQLSLNMYSGDFAGGTNSDFRFGLWNGSSVTFAGRMLGTSTDAGKFQVQTTGSGASFTDLLVDDDPVVVLEDTWYQITMTMTINGTAPSSEQTYDLQIQQMGTGGGVVFSGTDLTFTTTGNVAGDGGFYLHMPGASNTGEFSIANLHLVPEPSTILSVGLGLAMLLILGRRRRQRA